MTLSDTERQPAPEPRENHLPWQGTTGALRPAGRGRRDPGSTPARHGPASVTGPGSQYQNTSLSHCCEPANQNSCCNFCSFPSTSSCSVTAAPAAPPVPPSRRGPSASDTRVTVKPNGRATWCPLARPAPPEEPGIPSSSQWRPSHRPLSPRIRHGHSSTGGACPAAPPARAGPLSVHLQQQPQPRRARPFLPGTWRTVALSRQVPINGVFYLTGEIKSLYREAQKS